MRAKLQQIFIFFMKGKFKDKLITKNFFEVIGIVVVKIVRGSKFSKYTPQFYNATSNKPCTTGLKA